MIDDPSAKLQLSQNQTAQDFAQNLRQLDVTMTHDEKAQTYKRLQRKYYRPTSNIHIKQHIQRHRPQYVFHTPSASQIIDIENESKSHSTVIYERKETGENSSPAQFIKKTEPFPSSGTVDQLGEPNEKFGYSDSNNIGYSISINNLNQIGGQKKSPIGFNSDFDRKSPHMEGSIDPISAFVSPEGTLRREIVVSGGQDKYFAGELGQFARLTAKHEGKRRRATSASYSINSNAAKLQSKLYKEEAAGRYDHLIDTYQDETLRKSMRGIPKERQSLSTNKQPSMQPSIPSKNLPSHQTSVSKRHRESTPQILVRVATFQEKSHPTPPDPSTASDLRTIKKKLWEISKLNIQKRKNQRPSMPADSTFLSAFHRIGRRDSGADPTRIFKPIETVDMVETRTKLFKELNDRTEGWLDHSSCVMAEIEGVSKSDLEMAKYMHN
jgi:hypothetical protein